VLSHVHSRAPGGVVPVGALTSGPKESSKTWWWAVRRDIVADAQAQELSRDHWSKAKLRPVKLGAIVAGGLLALARYLGTGEALDRGNTGNLSGYDWLWGIIVLAAGGLFVWIRIVVWRQLQLDTPPGLRAASRWLGVGGHLSTRTEPSGLDLVWDQSLAYQIALGQEPPMAAAAGVRFGTEDHPRAWSVASGRWRQVAVRYPLGRPGSGRSPILNTVGALAIGAVSVIVVRFVLGFEEFLELPELSSGPALVVDIASAVVLIVALLVLAWQVLKLVLSLNDFIVTDVVEGVIVRRRVRHGWFGLRQYYSHSTTRSDSHRTRQSGLIALDTGHGDRVTAWRINELICDRTSQGGRFRVRVAPRLGYVRSVGPSAPIPRPGVAGLGPADHWRSGAAGCRPAALPPDPC